MKREKIETEIVNTVPSSKKNAFIYMNTYLVTK